MFLQASEIALECSSRHLLKTALWMGVGGAKLAKLFSEEWMRASGLNADSCLGDILL